MLGHGLTRLIRWGFILFEPELRAWDGGLPLARVFWIYGVLTSIAIGLLYMLAAEAGRRSLQQALLIILLAYTGWIVVAVWRCAEPAPPTLRIVARSLTVAWALNIILVTGFLQLDLIAAYLGS